MTATITSSIIIRCYNEERHIRRLLEGALAQSRKDFEIIVVDSGSTDRTIEIASEYPLRILRIQPEDFSFGYALNYGCKHAKGEFLVFISAHCYPTNSVWLENLVKPFEDPNVALVYGKQRGNETTRFFEHRIFQRLFPETSHVTESDPFCNNANTAIRKSIWERIPYDEDLTGLEDLDWARKALTLGFSLAYASDAEVVHVHEETSAQRFNRYKREAIALKRIVPDSHFNLADFVWLYSSNCLLDMREAMARGVLTEKALEILRCRWHQFAGTLSGYRFRGHLAKQMKAQFFYPGRFKESYIHGRAMSVEDASARPLNENQVPRIVALVPMRADSKRVPNKNIRLFNGKPLYCHIIESLLACPHIDEVYVNTNSEIIIEQLPKLYDRVRVIHRPADLCADTVPMNDILLHDVDYVQADWYVQTHSTNPLLRTETISKAIEAILAHPEYDSLFTVTPLYTRLWKADGAPLNHDPMVLLRTQDLQPVYEENSNLYIFRGHTLKEGKNRIGEKPLMIELTREEAWDIDEELDFRVAEFLQTLSNDSASLGAQKTPNAGLSGHR